MILEVLSSLDISMISHIWSETFYLHIFWGQLYISIGIFPLYLAMYNFNCKHNSSYWKSDILHVSALLIYWAFQWEFDIFHRRKVVYVLSWSRGGERLISSFLKHPCVVKSGHKQKWAYLLKGKVNKTEKWRKGREKKMEKKEGEQERNYTIWRMGGRVWESF